MKRLIFSGWSGQTELEQLGLAEIVLALGHQFVWGPLPPAEKLAAYFAPQTTDLGPGEHWSDGALRTRGDAGRKTSLADYCESFDSIELWFGATAQDQLQLVWLLDHLSVCPALAPKLGLRLLDSDLIVPPGYDLAKRERHIPLAGVGPREFETARSA